MTDPHAAYLLRLEARRTSETALGRRERSISNLRLAVFLAGFAIGWLGFVQQSIRPGWFVVPCAVFLALLFYHERVIRARARAHRAVSFYDLGVARIEERWSGRGVKGEQYLDPDHPYAADLDLFGEGSLFELLCIARTGSGRSTLAAWLLGPAAPDEVRARQAAVRELAGNIDLREDMALIGEEIDAGLHPAELRSWGAEPVRLMSAAARVAIGVIGVATLIALLGWPLGAGAIPFAVLALAGLLCGWRFHARVEAILAGADRAGKDLLLLADLLARLERERFTAPRLVAMRARLDVGGLPPAALIRRLQKLLDLADARRNPFFAPFALALLWSTQIAFALERWRAENGRALAGWLDVAGDLEALAALAGFSYEHPADPFPEIADGDARFLATGIGHPLLPRDRMVTNDLRFDASLRLVVLSGSNMSGKSTLLRTIGTNAVLALAGGPVRAAELILTPLVLGASIRIQDSLQKGSSRFYAEITRLRQIVDRAGGEVPLLFLLDEILHGTNSHDRCIGASAVVRTLVESGAMGIVTTHDLALAEIAKELAPRAANWHLDDHLKDGKMTFDYRLQPGVVEKSNALELMRAVGLRV